MAKKANKPTKMGGNMSNKVKNMPAMMKQNGMDVNHSDATARKMYEMMTGNGVISK